MCAYHEHKKEENIKMKKIDITKKVFKPTQSIKCRCCKVKINKKNRKTRTNTHTIRYSYQSVFFTYVYKSCKHH